MERFAIGQGTGLVCIACEEKQASQPTMRLPSEATRGDDCFALIPAERALDGTEVAYFGLDLDDQE
jgi:hypothetical protein